MPLGTQKEFVLIPAGLQKLKLVTIIEKEFPDKFNTNGGNPVNRLIWTFMSKQTDEDGVPYEYAVFTGETYGNDKAALTLLVDMVIPNTTPDSWGALIQEDGLNSLRDAVCDKWYEAQIKHVKGKDGGKARADHVYIKPIAPKSNTTAPAAEPVEAADGDDPFEED